MNRRELLRALGLAGVGLVGLPAGLARGEDEGPPRRLLVLSHCHGYPYTSWRIRPEGLGDTAPWQVRLDALSSADLGPILSPLAGHASRMLALDGLSLASAEIDAEGNRHDKGWIHAWTGHQADFSGSDTRSRGPSIDQLVAGTIARSDRLPSLELSVDGLGEAGRPIAYAANGARLPVLGTPDAAWRRLFGLASGDAGSIGRQREILAFAHGEYRQTSGLGRLQRERLDAHYDLLSRLGDRIEGLSALDCLPEPPAADLATYDARFDAFTDLVASAFACDVTRVATLSLGEMPTADFGWDDVTDDVHKGLAHGIYDDPQKHQAMTDYLARHARQVARLLDVLAGTPDIGGGTLLDNTLVVWGSELADGWHGYRHYCPVLFGGEWAFETGRYLFWPHETPIEMLVPASSSSGGYSMFSGRPHQQLLVSVARAMGVDRDHVGLERMQGQRGDVVFCRGEIEELLG